MPELESRARRWASGRSAREFERAPLLRSNPAAALYYALVARAILLYSTRGRSLRAIRWRWPDRAPSIERLERAAEQSECALAFRRAAEQHVDQVLAGALTDLLGPLYGEVVPARARLTAGEFPTPASLADELAREAWIPGASWLDPCAGSGAMALAVARAAARERADHVFFALESNPISALACAANIALAEAWRTKRPVADFVAPVACVDLFDESFRLGMAGAVDRIIGNPPWIGWDRLDEHFLARTRPLWERYGLFTEQGLDGILGGGKKDIAALATLVSVDRFLRPGGRLAFVLPKTLLKSRRAGRGFRRLRLPGGESLAVRRLDDVEALRPFPGAGAKAVLVQLDKGPETEFPVPYYLWSSRPGSHPARLAAGPSDSADATSPWRTWDPLLDDGDSGVVGASDYRAHLGVNTGGANGIYWFERLANAGGGRWRVRNLPGRGKSTDPPRTAELEHRFLFPLLTARDLRGWQALPRHWILLVQDPDRRVGIAEEVLAAEGPRALDYLRSYERRLRDRAAFRRYFQGRKSAAFYSMFNVGRYSLAPHKVVWRRIARTLQAALVGSLEGKPILPQETLGMIACDREDEGHFLCALLNSAPARHAIEAFAPVGSKSFATPGVIDRLALRRWRAADPLDAELARLGRSAGAETANEGEPDPRTLERIDALARRYWRAPPRTA